MPRTPFPLGRHQQFDARSRQYPLTAVLPKRAASVSKSWACRVHLDQGNLGSCVGNGWTHAYAASPHGHTSLTEDDALAIYKRATKIDNIPGNYPPSDTGSSVLAGAKATVEHGWFSTYRWAFSVDDIIKALSTLGPVVVGTDWYDDMFNPAPRSGLIEVTGQIAGGHCYLLRGVKLNHHVIGTKGLDDYFVIRNSWGEGWGNNSDAHIRVSDFEKLLTTGGDACIPTKT
jgi:hypothetical protein